MNYTDIERNKKIDELNEMFTRVIKIEVSVKKFIKQVKIITIKGLDIKGLDKYCFIYVELTDADIDTAVKETMGNFIKN